MMKRVWLEKGVGDWIETAMSHTTAKLLSTFLSAVLAMVLLWHSHGPLSSIYVHVGCVENCILPMCVSDASKQCRAIIMSKLGSPGWRRSWCWLSLSWVYHHFKHTFQLWAVSMQIASVTLMISNFLKIFRIMPNFMMSAQSRPVGQPFFAGVTIRTTQRLNWAQKTVHQRDITRIREQNHLW